MVQCFYNSKKVRHTNEGHYQVDEVSLRNLIFTAWTFAKLGGTVKGLGLRNARKAHCLTSILFTARVYILYKWKAKRKPD